MTALPAAYAWLAREGAPRMLVEALKLYGVLETPGPKSNPVIIAWAAEVGSTTKAIYKGDDVPWCGLFMAVVAKRADKGLPPVPLRALDWANFGVKAATPSLGDVLVFKRNGGGHVGLYVGEDERHFYVLGGNQSDAVTITRIEKARLFAARRPIYNVQPANVRPLRLSTGSAVSTNEA